MFKTQFPTILWIFCLNVTGIALLTPHGALSHSMFQDRIPNARSVPDPCHSDKLWPGVGHWNINGGGERNPFGLDFADQNFKWTKILCETDSDGDGLTNGQELGDPDCVWTPGATPQRTTNITHPGICNPCNTTRCLARRRDNVQMHHHETHLHSQHQPQDFDCPAAEGAFYRDYRLKHMHLATNSTKYICQAFEVVTNDTWYMIGNMPLINNSLVVHHLTVYGCSQKPEASKLTTPYECMMGDSECTTIVANWGIGYPNECLDPMISVKFGGDRMRYITMQLHWTNLELRDDLWDSSGIRFYYQRTPRKYEAGMMMTGQQKFYLLPGLPAVNVSSVCSGQVTKQLFALANVSSIFVVSALPHMHLRGRYTSVELYRDGVKLADIFPYQRVDYSSPPFVQVPKIEVKPGDSIKVLCTFSTLGDTKPIIYGEDTASEMCYGFLRYYPRLQLQDDTCIHFGPLSYNLHVALTQLYNGCNYTSFLDDVQSHWLPLARKQCSSAASSCAEGPCRDISQAIHRHPCMQKYTEYYLKIVSRQSDSVSSIMSPLMSLINCNATSSDDEHPQQDILAME